MTDKVCSARRIRSDLQCVKDCCGGVNLPPKLLQNVIHLIHHLLPDGTPGLDGFEALEQLESSIGATQLPSMCKSSMSQHVDFTSRLKARWIDFPCCYLKETSISSLVASLMLSLLLMNSALRACHCGAVDFSKTGNSRLSTGCTIASTFLMTRSMPCKQSKVSTCRTQLCNSLQYGESLTK